MPRRYWGDCRWDWASFRNPASSPPIGLVCITLTPCARANKAARQVLQPAARRAVVYDWEASWRCRRRALRVTSSSGGEVGACVTCGNVFMVFFLPPVVRQCSPHAMSLLRTNVKHVAFRRFLGHSTRSLQHQGYLFEALPYRHSQSRPQNQPQLRKMSQTTLNKSTQDPYRLPRNVKPVHYNLLVKTDLEALQFEGHVAIEWAQILWYRRVCSW